MSPNYLGKIVILFAACLTFTQLSEAKVYKWIDKNGKVHYADRPFNEKSEVVDIKDNISQKQQQAAARKARRMIQIQNQRINNQLEAEKEDVLQKQQQQLKADKLNRTCQEARQSLKILQMQTRVYNETENGKREYISDEKRQQEIIRLKKNIADHCNN